MCESISHPVCKLKGMKILKTAVNILIIAGVLILVFNKGIVYADGNGILPENEIKGELGGGISTEEKIKAEMTIKPNRIPYYLSGLGLLLVLGGFFYSKRKQE